MTVKLGNSAAATDPGRKRRHNEDSYVCEPPLFAVADGIGGAQAGEVASGLAAATLRDDSGDGDGDAGFRVDAKPGDLFLLCSDGLTTMVDGKTILREIEGNRDDLRAAAKALVRAANRGGGEDNITVVFFEIVGDDDHAGDTLTLPPQQGPAAESDDAETLDEVDRVPV